MNGWLLDTNVVAELAKSRGTVRVAGWAAVQDDALLFISILTLGEYQKGLHNVPPDSPLRLRIAAGIAAMEVRFADRLLPLTDAIVRRRGAVSGEVKRQTAQSPSVIDTLLALVTRNLRDVRHSGATLFNPWEASPERQTPNRNQRR